jgi:hypothetical protein
MRCSPPAAPPAPPEPAAGPAAPIGLLIVSPLRLRAGYCSRDPSSIASTTCRSGCSGGVENDTGRGRSRLFMPPAQRRARRPERSGASADQRVLSVEAVAAPGTTRPSDPGDGAGYHEVSPNRSGAGARSGPTPAPILRRPPRLRRYRDRGPRGCCTVRVNVGASRADHPSASPPAATSGPPILLMTCRIGGQLRYRRRTNTSRSRSDIGP